MSARKPHPLESRAAHGVRVHAGAFARLVDTIARFDGLGQDEAAIEAARGIDAGIYRLKIEGAHGHYIMGRAS